MNTTPTTQESPMTAEVRSYTNEKLNRELAFADACKDDSGEAARWFALLQAEAARRAG